MIIKKEDFLDILMSSDSDFMVSNSLDNMPITSSRYQCKLKKLLKHHLGREYVLENQATVCLWLLVQTTDDTAIKVEYYDNELFATKLTLLNILDSYADISRLSVLQDALETDLFLSALREDCDKESVDRVMELVTKSLEFTEDYLEGDTLQIIDYINSDDCKELVELIVSLLKGLRDGEEKKLGEWHRDYMSGAIDPADQVKEGIMTFLTPEEFDEMLKTTYGKYFLRKVEFRVNRRDIEKVYSFGTAIATYNVLNLFVSKGHSYKTLYGYQTYPVDTRLRKAYLPILKSNAKTITDLRTSISMNIAGTVDRDLETIYSDLVFAKFCRTAMCYDRSYDYDLVPKLLKDLNKEYVEIKREKEMRAKKSKGIIEEAWY